MKNIDASLIEKYINGDDLGEYSIEQLENDKDFMTSVINYTNDVKMYSLCSDELKKNYEFVKYLVLKFKDNPDYITKIADYYFGNSDIDIERIELGIIMEKILPQDSEIERLISQNLKYKVLNDIEYGSEKFEINVAKAENPKLESMIGMGFLAVFDSYNDSDIILDYYAKRFLDDIIEENDIDFEKMLHNQFKSADKIKEVGINNYIINFISCYDSMLSQYMSTHLDLIKPVANKIKNIQDNWDSYLIKDEEERYNNMLDMVHDYMSTAISYMEENDILYYVAKELGITEKVKEYDDMIELDVYDEELVDDMIELDVYDEELVDDMIKFDIEQSLKERLVYLKVKKIIINQLFAKKPLDLDSLVNEKKYNNSNSNSNNNGSENSKCKIIKLTPNDKK